VFSERGLNFLNYVQYIFQGGEKKILMHFPPGYGPGPTADLNGTIPRIKLHP